MSQPIQQSDINLQVQTPYVSEVSKKPINERKSMTDKLMRTDRPTAIKAVITAILCLIAFCLIVFGEGPVAAFGWILAFIVGGVYAYLYRVRLKKFMGISESIEKDADSYRLHHDNLDKLRLRRAKDELFMPYDKFHEYDLLVTKMKSIGVDIADPAQRDKYEYNVTLLRDTANKANEISEPYVSKL